MTKGHFQAPSLVGRPRARRVDNELLAQAWLSFIGFSAEAVHSKRDIFENENWYDFIFLHTPKRHGCDYNYNIDEARQDCYNQSPPPPLMLAAYLAREFARRAAPTAKENRDQAIKRLKLDVVRTPKDEVQKALNSDDEFLLGLILNGMSFEFVELFGFVLYKVLGSDISTLGSKVTSNRTFSALSSQLDFEDVEKRIADQQFESDDILAILWYVFRHLLEEMLGGAWRLGYLTARSRSRFLHSVETRKRLEQGVLQLHQFTEKTQLTRTWASGIKPRKGLFGAIRDALQNS